MYSVRICWIRSSEIWRQHIVSATDRGAEALTSLKGDYYVFEETVNIYAEEKR